MWLGYTLSASLPIWLPYSSLILMLVTNWVAIALAADLSREYVDSVDLVDLNGTLVLSAYGKPYLWFRTL
jgi:hypothetical protein